MKRPGLWISLALVGVMIALAVAAGSIGFLQAGSPEGRTTGKAAPEFEGIASWINSEPLTMRSLRGRVVMIDFWAYSCVNCVRTFPHVRALYATYHRAGLEVVGVHSPEFDFEKDLAKVSDAVARHRLRYPVAMDSDMATWRAFENNYWPRVFLIDAAGVIRFDHIGEGGEAQIQARIRELLVETGATLPPPVSLSPTGPSSNITPEIYAGYERGGYQGSLGNEEGYEPGEIVDYEAPSPAAIGAAGTAGTFFLSGSWRAEQEYVEAVTDGARIVLPFRARDVYAVAEASPKAALRVLLDGKPTTMLGDDAPDGVVSVDRSDLFHLLAFDEVRTHTLTLIADAGFRLYTFTFG